MTSLFDLTQDEDPHGSIIPPSQLLEPLPKQPEPVVAPVAEVPPPMPAPDVGNEKPQPPPQPQLTRETLDRAFPRAPGPDWADLKQKMERAYGNASTRASVDNFLTNLGGNSSFGGGYKGSPEARQLDLKAAALPMEMAEAQQKYALTQANIDKAFRPKEGDPYAAARLKLEQDQLAENKRYHDLLAGKGVPTPEAKAEDLASMKAAARAILKTEAGKASGITDADIDGVTTRKDLEDIYAKLQAPKPVAPPKAAKGAGVPVDAATQAESQKFMMGKYKIAPRPGTKPSKEDMKHASEKASMWGAAFNGMDVLEGSLTAYAQNPGPDTARTVSSQVRAVAAALNSANLGGAMSQDEFEGVSKALGADLASPAGVQALIDSVLGRKAEGAETLVRRLKAARQASEAAARGQLGGANYVVEEGDAKPVATGEPRPVGAPRRDKKTGKIYQVYDDNTAEEVTGG